MIPAAEYARRIGVGKNRLTALFAKGLPFTEGKDDHGRLCKLVDPARADDWRSANLTPKTDANGRVRGIVEAASGAASPPSMTPSPASMSAERIQAARAESQEIDLEARRTRLEAARGRLVDRAAAVDVVKAFAGAVGVAIDRMPADCATTLAEELGVDHHQAFQALRRVGDRLRDDLARHADANAERAAALGGS